MSFVPCVLGRSLLTSESPDCVPMVGDFQAEWCDPSALESGGSKQSTELYTGEGDHGNPALCLTISALLGHTQQ
jgi:hypothetical protein